MLTRENSPHPDRRRGLSGEEAAKRLDLQRRRFSPATPAGKVILDFLSRFRDPLIVFLLAMAGLTSFAGFWTGSFFDGIEIILIVLLVTLVGFVAERKAMSEFLEAERLGKDFFAVLRDGRLLNVPSRNIVHGDLIEARAGDRFAFPVAAIDSNGLELLSPGEDHPHQPAENEMFPAGTSVTGGVGHVLVLETENVAQVSPETGRTLELGDESPLTAQMRRLVQFLFLVSVTGGSALLVLFLTRDAIQGNLSGTREQFFLVGTGCILFLGVISRRLLTTAMNALETVGFEVTGDGLFHEVQSVPWRGLLGFAVVALLTGLIGIQSGFFSSGASAWFGGGFFSRLIDHLVVVLAIVVVISPDGLSLNVILSLARGMLGMHRWGVYPRNLHAGETLGNIGILCIQTDSLIDRSREEVGIAQFGTGDSSVPPIPLSPDDFLTMGLFAGIQARKGTRTGDSAGVVIGKPFDKAMYSWFREAGVDPDMIRNRFEIISTTDLPPFPATTGLGKGGSADGGSEFTIARLREKNPPESTIGKEYFLVRGDGECVFSRCDKVLQGNPRGVSRLEEAGRVAIVRNMSDGRGDGFRIVGFAVIPLNDHGQESQELEVPAKGWSWLGWIGVEASVRDDVASFLESLKTAGISFKLLSGLPHAQLRRLWKHLGNAAREKNTPSIIECSTFSKVPLAERASELASHDVAHVSGEPGETQDYFEALRSEGHLVGTMTASTERSGAGPDLVISTTPSGQVRPGSGNPPSPSGPDVVLCGDSLPSLVKAIAQGRSISRNIKRFMVFEFSANLLLMGLSMISPLLGLPAALTALQILWTHLLLDSSGAIVLALTPPGGDILGHPPRRRHDFLLTAEMVESILLFSVLSLAALLLLAHGREVPLFQMFFLAVFWRLAGAVLSGSRMTGTGIDDHGRKTLFLLIGALAGHVLLTQNFGAILRTDPLPYWEWLVLILGTAPLAFVGMTRESAAISGSVTQGVS